MIGCGDAHSSFHHRVEAIPPQGLGLSVDVYSPDLIELVACLKKQGLAPGYLEIFKATTTALRAVRRRLPGVALAYHGEGLWITQPESRDQPVFHQQVEEAALHQQVLGSLWLNHECATKQMAGYSFGTYLPPLYTATSAAVVAEHIGLVQAVLDARGRDADHASPLFLLEMPPLTYFAAGTIPIPDFFRLVTEQASCGLVLDMGHLWTVYRYTNAQREQSLESFVQSFLDDFPMERVVEMHLAGLAVHERRGVAQRPGEKLPAWLDAHAAPIPSVLWRMLEQVLQHPRLVNLRGVALEVDTKPIAVIVDEFDEAHRRFAPLIQHAMARLPNDAQILHVPAENVSVTPADRAQLYESYARYACIVSGLESPLGSEWQRTEREGLEEYRTAYLPHEILHWGGEVTAMFPETCQALEQQGIALAELVRFWCDRPRMITGTYDFFLLKIDRFVEFVAERVPQLALRAEQEADLLRRAYAEANEVDDVVMEPIA